MFVSFQIAYFNFPKGRNEYAISKITWELGILAWEEAFICIQQEDLSDSMRANYCKLISGKSLGRKWT